MGGATSSIDYPVVTVSSWAFDPVTMASTRHRPSSTTSSSSSTDILAVIWSPFASTPTWPPIAFPGKDGEPSTTAPPCAFAVFQCPPRGDPDGPGGGGGSDPDQPDDPDDPDDENGSCLAHVEPPTQQPTPKYDHADPSKNTRDCYNIEQWT